jgi:hypothetical protein
MQVRLGKRAARWRNVPYSEGEIEDAGVRAAGAEKNAE